MADVVAFLVLELGVGFVRVRVAPTKSNLPQESFSNLETWGEVVALLAERDWDLFLPRLLLLQ